MNLSNDRKQTATQNNVTGIMGLSIASSKAFITAGQGNVCCGLPLPTNQPTAPAPKLFTTETSQASFRTRQKILASFEFPQYRENQSGRI
jgi:hypothetical protein